MASNVFGAKQFKPTPPQKGSFPLDHEGVCKEFYVVSHACPLHTFKISSNKPN